MNVVVMVCLRTASSLEASRSHSWPRQAAEPSYSRCLAWRCCPCSSPCFSICGVEILFLPCKKECKAARSSTGVESRMSPGSSHVCTNNFNRCLTAMYNRGFADIAVKDAQWCRRPFARRGSSPAGLGRGALTLSSPETHGTVAVF